MDANRANLAGEGRTAMLSGRRGCQRERSHADETVDRDEQGAMGVPRRMWLEFLEGRRSYPPCLHALIRQTHRQRHKTFDVVLGERKFERSVASVDEFMATVGAKPVDEAVVQRQAARAKITKNVGVA